MAEITFSVMFVSGKARPRFTRSGRAYTPKTTKDAESIIRNAYKSASKTKYGEVMSAPIGTPVSVSVETNRPLPKSTPKKTTSQPDTLKPDSDNILKLVCDALNGVAYHDDAQVTRATVQKNNRRRDISERTDVRIQF